MKTKEPKAVDLIRAFNALIEADKNHPLHRRLSYPHRDKLLKAAKKMSWIEVWDQQEKLTDRLLSCGGKKGGPLAAKTIEFAWAWAARSFEHAYRCGSIPVNPLRHLLTKNDLALNPCVRLDKKRGRYDNPNPSQ